MTMEKFSKDIEYSRTIKDLKFYYYIIFCNGNYYEVEVSDDGISQEVEHPNDEARLI
jgi:hypothetical protein